MAKGLRSSVKKSNRSKLRSKIFQPVEDTRTQRLSAKLLELASQPRPTRAEMELDSDKSESLGHEAGHATFSDQATVMTAEKENQQEDTMAPQSEGGFEHFCFTFCPSACDAPEGNSVEEIEAAQDWEMLFLAMGLAADVYFDQSGRLVCSSNESFPT
jgi:hypothetical protein